MLYKMTKLILSQLYSCIVPRLLFILLFVVPSIALADTFITDTDSVTVPEGGTAAFQVKLDAPPSSMVRAFVFRLSGDTDITVQSSVLLTFTPGNWDSFQPVTLTAAEDADIVDGTATIRISAAGIPDKDVTATEADNDTLAFVTNTDAVTVPEGGTAAFQVKLDAPPSVSVNASVIRQSGDTDINVQSGSLLTFTPANWDSFQPVTLAAAEDADNVDGTTTIRISAAGIPDKDITATEADNDSSTVDILIYGGTSAGVVAAYASKMQGRRVLLVEPSTHLGGMSSSGLSATDTGKTMAITGLAADFYTRVGAKYGLTQPEYFFEPHVAEEVFNDYISEANVDIMLLKRLKSVERNGLRISSIVLEDALNPNLFTDIHVEAEIFIDATYEGDLLAAAGVSYTIGRESNATYGETYNGVQVLTQNQFPDGISPYIVEGESQSGILPGINPEPLAPIGSGDAKVQTYNYRLCMTMSPLNRIPLPPPNNYDPQNYEVLGRLIANGYILDLADIFFIRALRGDKFDFNNGAPISTDFVGGSWDYPDASYFERNDIEREHKEWILGLFRFLDSDPRVPQVIRDELGQWGLCKDEFVENAGWPYRLYVREARRMVGRYVMTEDDIMGRVFVNDGIAFGSYGMDSHETQRVIVNGMVKNEGNTWISTPNPYMISYRSMTPESRESVNLLVPVCLSASHIAYGSIRVEPVFMALGEAAGVAASMAAEAETGVQEIDVQKLKDSLDLNLAIKFVDVPTGYWAEEAIYKIYDAGISTGCSSNPLKYCPGNTVTRSQMAVFLGRGIHGSAFVPPPARGLFSDVSVGSWAADWIEQFYGDGITGGCSANPLMYCPDNPVTRAQMAVFLLKSKHGENYTPPDAAGIFDDVPTTHWAADWIEQLHIDGITGGCSANPMLYCPDSSVTRAQMAVFIVRTFDL